MPIDLLQKKVKKGGKIDLLSNYIPRTTPLGGGYKQSDINIDPYSNKKTLVYPEVIPQTFLSPEQTIQFEDTSRVAPSFDFTKPQKITRNMLRNDRMPENVSSKIREQLGAGYDEALDHQIALTLAGSNLRKNLKVLSSEKNQSFGTKEGELANKVINGEISLLDAQREMAKEKGFSLPEDAKQPNAVQKWLLNTPEILVPLAKVQESPIKAVGEGIKWLWSGIKKAVENPESTVVGAGTAIENFGLGIGKTFIRTITSNPVLNTPLGITGTDENIKKVGKEQIKQVEEQQKAFTELAKASIPKTEDSQVAYEVGNFVGSFIPYVLAGSIATKLGESGAVGAISKFGGGLSVNTVSKLGTVVNKLSNLAGFLSVGQIEHSEDEGTRAQQVVNDLAMFALFEAGLGTIKLTSKLVGKLTNVFSRMKSGERIPLKEVENVVKEANTEVKSQTNKKPQQIVADEIINEKKDIKISEEPTISKELEPLIQEAKKYKSAEEFVKAQTENNLYHGGYDIGQDNMIRLGHRGGKYTGNDMGGVFFTPSEKYATGYVKANNGALYKAKLDLKAEKIFDASKPSDMAKLEKIVGKDVINLINDSMNKGAADWATLGQYVNEIEEAGFSGAKFLERPGENIDLLPDGSYKVSGKPVYSYSIFHDVPVEKSLTKSQLTDIWNKANKKPQQIVADEIINEKKDIKISEEPIKPIISKELEPLLQEARKYKSAEEFVKAQPTIYRGDTTPIKLSEMDTTKVFNAAEKEALSAFNNTPGLYFTDSISNAKSYGKNITSVSIEPSAKVINVNDAHKILKRADVERIIRSNPRIKDWSTNWSENFNDAIKQITDSVMAEKDGNEFLKAIWSDGGFSEGDFVNAMKKAGIDGINVPKEGVNHFVIYNKDILKAKSQLTDIWNKANKTLEIKPDVEKIKVPQSQLPVGTGKEKVSRLEARIKNRLDALSNEEKASLSTYKEMNKQDQIKKAVEYVTKNPDEAVEVLLGNKPVPKGLLYNSIFLAMEENAKTSSDLALKLSSLRSTRFGQELSILTERDINSPVKYLSDYSSVQIEAYGGKVKFEQIKNQETGNLKRALKSNNLTKTDWGSFVNSIKCQ